VAETVETLSLRLQLATDENVFLMDIHCVKSVNLNIQEARKTKASHAPTLCSTHVWLCSVS